MNDDIHKIFESYTSKRLDEQPVASPAAPVVAGPTENMPVRSTGPVDPAQAMATVEQLFTNGPGQDQQTVQSQVNALAAAQQAINPAIQKATQELEAVRDKAEQGIAVSDQLDPTTGGYRQESQIQQLNQQYTRLSQLAQSVKQQAATLGIDTSVLMESMQIYMDHLQEKNSILAEAIIPGKTKQSAERRLILREMIAANTVPNIELVEKLLTEQDRGNEEDGEDFSSDSNYLRDVLGMEPEDFEHEDPDQAAFDRMDSEKGIDTVELANRDRPASGPEDGLMDDVHALERLLDDETKAVLDDEGGNMTRREAREIAKDIIKQMIDGL